MKNVMRAPFIRHHDSVHTVVVDVAIASLPAILWSVYVYGFRCVTIYCVSILTAMLCELVFTRLLFRSSRTFDVSCVITGIVVAFALPAAVPLWLPAFASFAGIVIAKGLFGGAGKNLFNPAASGICLSYILFAEKMTVFTKPFEYLSPLSLEIPVSRLSEIRVSTALDNLRQGIASPGTIMDEFYGLAPGTIGEVSALLLLLGLIFLLFRRTVHFNSAFTYVITVMALSLLVSYADCEPTQFVEIELFAGNTMLILLYMLNDYTTTPTTSFGRIAFAFLLAGGVVVFRRFGDPNYAEFFAVLAVNVFTPFIERYTYPKVFGSKIRRSV